MRTQTQKDAAKIARAIGRYRKRAETTGQHIEHKDDGGIGFTSDYRESGDVMWALHQIAGNGVDHEIKRWDALLPVQPKKG